MSNVRGADIEALAELARTLQNGANQLNTVSNAATAGATALNAIWEGPDSRQFRQVWNTDHRPKLAQASQELLDAASTIERNLQAQEQTSATVDGAVGGGGGGGGGGFWSGFGDRAGDALGWLTGGGGGGGGGGWGLPDIGLPDIGLPDIGVPDFISDSGIGDGIRLPGFVTEAGSRFAEYGEYLNETWDRRGGIDYLTSPGGITATVFEDGAAALGILGLGGELYHGDPDGYCGGSQSCITGVTTPLGGAITLGHTVLYTPDVPAPHLIAHEQQHVYQYEEHGTLGFLGRWVGSSAVDFVLGGDGYIDTAHEREGYYVQDNYDAGVRPSPDLVVPDSYQTSDEHGYQYGRGDRSEEVRDLSIDITEAIWGEPEDLVGRIGDAAGQVGDTVDDYLPWITL